MSIENFHFSKNPDNKGSFGGDREASDDKEKIKYPAPRRKGESIYPVISDSFIPDKKELVEAIKKRQLEVLKQKKQNENKVPERHEQPLSEKEIADTISQIVGIHTGRDLTNKIDPNYIDRSWNFTYKDLEAQIFRKYEDSSYFEYNAHRHCAADDMNWMDSDDARHQINAMTDRNNNTTMLKKDIEDGTRKSKKNKQEYVDLFLETKAVQEFVNFDRSDKESLKEAVEKVFTKLDELARL